MRREKLRKLTKLALYKVTGIIWQGRQCHEKDGEKRGMCVELDVQGEGRSQRGRGQVRWTRGQFEPQTNHYCNRLLLNK